MANGSRLHPLGESQETTLTVAAVSIICVKKKKPKRDPSHPFVPAVQTLTLIPGGELGGPMGKLSEFPGPLLLGMCLPAHGDHVYRWLWRRVC